MRKDKLVSTFSLPRFFTLLAAITFLGYTVLRAHLLSMTHDESGSFIIWTHYNIFSCFVDPGCWRSANLHFLYVLLMKATVGLFGISELTIRMPSLFGHLIYLFFSWKIIKMWTDKPWLQLIGFVVINSNPFLLEFFSLGRGYGLANAFMMMSLYYMGLFFKTKNKGAAWGMYAGAVLAVLSNFTMLNYYACMIAATGIVFSYLFIKKENTAIARWNYLLKTGVGVSATLLVVLYMPVMSLSKGGEFEYGAQSFWDTFSSNVKTSLYTIKYMHSNHVEILGGLYVLMLATGLVFAFRYFIKKPESATNQFILAASLLPVLVALATVVQHYLLGVNYLRGRTALVFVPLTTVALFLFFINILKKQKSRRPWVIPVVAGIFCVVHAFRAYQLKRTFEWWYDARTKDMIEYMDSIVPEGKK
ncbi:MAG TPA: hypothetical protein ENJ20_00225, partial [Bacteroidetes bacterium]|nr:hypothetical protein [Bacteroidota bacterium]